MWLFFPLQCVFLLAEGTRPSFIIVQNLLTQAIWSTPFLALLTPDNWESFESLFLILKTPHAEFPDPAQKESLFEYYFEDVLLTYSACLFPALPRIRQTT